MMPQNSEFFITEYKVIKLASLLFMETLIYIAKMMGLYKDMQPPGTYLKKIMF